MARILIADDDELIAELASEVLIDAGHACGWVTSAEDAWARIRAGASLVQLYSAMTYAGPGIARQITRGLERLMRRDGFSTIAEAVGTE